MRDFLLKFPEICHEKANGMSIATAEELLRQHCVNHTPLDWPRTIATDGPDKAKGPSSLVTHECSNERSAEGALSTWGAAMTWNQRWERYALTQVGDRKGTTKKLCDKDFAERSAELSGAIASKPFFYWVMTHNPLELFRKFFGAVRAIFWLCGSFLPLEQGRDRFWDIQHPETTPAEQTTTVKRQSLSI